MRGLVASLLCGALLIGCASHDGVFIDPEGLNVLAIDAVEQNQPAVIIDVRPLAERQRTPSGPRWVPIQYGFDDWNAPRIMLREDDVAFIRAVAATVDGNRAARIMVICERGERSMFAAMTLRHAGFSQVWNVVDGVKGNRHGHGWLFAEAWHGVPNKTEAAKR